MHVEKNNGAVFLEDFVLNRRFCLLSIVENTCKQKKKAVIFLEDFALNWSLLSSLRGLDGTQFQDVCELVTSRV